MHCKDYKEYWEWVEKRNPERYKENTKSNNTNFDLKNMMHTVRLVEMAEDIVNKQEIVVRRPNREELLSIRRGEKGFEEIMVYVEEKVKNLNSLFEHSALQEDVNREEIRDLLATIRKKNYVGIF